MVTNLAEEINEAYVKSVNLPDKPGVYMFKDNKGEIIYVGKSKALHKRVSYYFKKEEKFGNTKEEILYGDKIRKLVSKIADLDFIITENEKEALILESDLIKRYQPIYNAMLKDDKSFPWLMITYSEEFPRILVVRQPRKYHNAGKKTTEKQKKRNKFYGPYIDVRPMKNTLKILRKYFPYCTCKRPVSKKNRPCLNYQIKLCPGPCAGKISKKNYMQNINRIDRILSGDLEGIISELTDIMKNASAKMDFESAAIYRDTIEALKGMIQRQSIVNYDDTEKINRDIIGHYKTLKKIGILIMHIREGRLVGKTPHIIEASEKLGTDWEILNSFLAQYYLETDRNIPEQIILSGDLLKSEYLDSELLVSVIKDNHNKVISIKSAGKSKYTKSLLRIAHRNVQLMIKLEDEYEKLITEADALSDLGMKKDLIQRMDKKDREALVGLKEIRDLLKLDEIPRIIEGFDISNLSQGDATGSMVCFIDGKPSKKNYRSYTIRNVTIQGDFHMMQEVIERRYKRVLRDNGIMPDLIIVDGGKAQVNAANGILEKFGLDQIKVVGLKKGKVHSQINEIVFKEQINSAEVKEIQLKKNTAGYNVLQNISSEYHRRAIQHHRKRLEKRMLSSELDDVPGIGEKTKVKLLDHFKTVENVKKAKIEELKEKLGEKTGEKIFNSLYEFFKNKKPVVITERPKKIIKIRKLAKK